MRGTWHWIAEKNSKNIFEKNIDGGLNLKMEPEDENWTKGRFGSKFGEKWGLKPSLKINSPKISVEKLNCN